VTIACPRCGEVDSLEGRRQGELITLTCGACGLRWERDPSPTCDRCEGTDMYPAIAAIVEKGRGSQLSVVGTRVVHLCEDCDAERLARYFRSRPNPLMPDELPNAPGEN
jgi:transcription elongation factor Elf1